MVLSAENATTSLRTDISSKISLASCPYQWGGIFYGIDSLDSVAGVLKISQNTVFLPIFERAAGSCEFMCLAAVNGGLGCL